MQKEQVKVKEEKKPNLQDLTKQLEYWKNKLFELMNDHNNINERDDARKNVEYLEKEISYEKSIRPPKEIEKEQLRVLYDNQSIISTSLGLRKDPFSLKKQNELQQIQKGR